MSAGVYANINGVTRKGKKLYAKINGVTRPIKEVWVKVNGVSRCVYRAVPQVINTEYDYSNSQDWNCYLWQNSYEADIKGDGGHCRIFPAFDKAFTIKHVVLYGTIGWGAAESEYNSSGEKNKITFDLYHISETLASLTLTADETSSLSGKSEGDCNIYVGANDTGYIRFDINLNAILEAPLASAYIYAEVTTAEYGIFRIPLTN